MVVGDALLQKAFSWKLSDNVQLSFHEDSLADIDHLSSYSAKPEIIHKFREEEKRPPQVVSLVFSGLCLLPLLILLILVRKQKFLFLNFLLNNSIFNSGLSLVSIFLVYHWDSVH